MANLRKRIVEALGFPIEFARSVRFELAAFLVRVSPLVRVSRARIRGVRSLKLNIGCGDTRFPGWLNIDVVHNPLADIYVDLRQRLPFETGSVRLIFAEHVIEHLRAEEAVLFLKECHRVLEPGGAIRLITPDLRKFAAAYVQGDRLFFQRTVPELPDPVAALNLTFRRGGSHHYLFDIDELARFLRDAGFTRTLPSQYRTSVCEELNLDFDGDLRREESLYIDAVR